MPPALQPEVIQIILNLATKYGFRKLDQILEYVITESWSALRLMRARIALADPNNQRRRSRPQETDSDIWEIPREEFEQAMVGGHH